MVNQATVFLEVPYVAGDTETTGLSPERGDRICEIALVRFLKGEAVDRLVTLINPEVPIPAEVTAVNGITDEMVANAPTFAQVLPDLLSFVRAKPLVFHNAPFDLGFLRSEAVRANQAWPALPVLDTLDMARQSGLFPNNRLTTICQTLGITTDHHRAEGDAWATGKVLLHLVGNPRVRIRNVA